MVRITLAALALVLGACSGTARPIVAPGEVAVVGDVVFRTGEDGAIFVRARRSLGGHSAVGTATLHAMDLETAKHSALVGVARARAWLALAAFFPSDPVHRYEAAQHAVSELGTEYRKARPHLIDHTAKHLQIAEALAAQGDHAAAADEAFRAVQSRIALYLRSFPGQLTLEPPGRDPAFPATSP